MNGKEALKDLQKLLGLPFPTTFTLHSEGEEYIEKVFNTIKSELDKLDKIKKYLKNEECQSHTSFAIKQIIED